MLISLCPHTTITASAVSGKERDWEAAEEPGPAHYNVQYNETSLLVPVCTSVLKLIIIQKVSHEQSNLLTGETSAWHCRSNFRFTVDSVESPLTVRVLLKLKMGEGVKALSKIPNQHCCIQLCCVIIDFDTHFLILLDSIHESGTEHFLSQNEREQCPQAFCSQRGSEKHWKYSITTTHLHLALCETRERTVQKRREEGCLIHWAQQSKLQVRFFQSSCTSQMKWLRHFWAKGKAPEADIIFWFTIGIN